VVPLEVHGDLREPKWRLYHTMSLIPDLPTWSGQLLSGSPL
jgi:hypothetical protein